MRSAQDFVDMLICSPLEDQCPSCARTQHDVSHVLIFYNPNKLKICKLFSQNVFNS